MPEMMKREERHRPHFSTWLNQERYKDVAETPKQRARVIACKKCGDSGLEIAGYLGDSHAPVYTRCSCPRGALPGLVIPQAEETPF
jgi:hypothetical protein